MHFQNENLLIAVCSLELLWLENDISLVDRVDCNVISIRAVPAKLTQTAFWENMGVGGGSVLSPLLDPYDLIIFCLVWPSLLLIGTRMRHIAVCRGRRRG
jgi:hypothetical protein